MKSKLVNLCAAILVALALSACSGSGDNPADAAAKVSITDTAPTVPTAKETEDVTFVNVPTNPQKTSVIPGERDFEVVAVRVIVKDQSTALVSQLVYKNQLAPVNLRETFKGFRLMDSLGNDVKREALYVVNYDEENQLVVIDFPQSPWVPNNYGVVVPKTYSLLAATTPSVPERTKFAFKLIAAQLHNYGATVEIDNVEGEQFTVTNVPGMGLPTITTSSSGHVIVPDNLIGTMVKVGSITASCPEKNKEACVLVRVKYSVYGGAPYLEIGDSLSFGSNQDGFPHYSGYTSSDIRHYLSPGQTQTFTVFVWAYQTGVIVYVDDMEWEVGQTKVSPIVPTGSAACNLMVGDWQNCKG